MSNKLFDKIDKERYEIENRDDKIKDYLSRIDMEENLNWKTMNYRLMKDHEVPDWIRLKKIDDKEVMMKEYGKGMRIKPKVTYKDDFDDNQLEQIFYDDERDEDGKKKRSRKSLKVYEVNNWYKRKKFSSSNEKSEKSNKLEDDSSNKANFITSGNNNRKIMINTELMTNNIFNNSIDKELDDDNYLINDGEDFNYN